VGTPSGTLTALRVESGKPLWQAELGGAVTGISASQSSESTCLIAHVARQGERIFAAVHPTNGSVLWEAARGPVEASWAYVDADRVVLSTPSAGVVVLKLPDRT